MEIIIEENNKGTLKISSLVVRKFIYKILTTDSYQVQLADIDVLDLENNNIVAEIKLTVDAKADLIDLKSKINNLILKRVETVLNLVLLNIHLIFMAKNEKAENYNAKSKKSNPAR